MLTGVGMGYFRTKIADFVLKGVRMGYLRTKTADFVLRSRKKRYLRTKTTPFCADDGQGVRLRFLVQVP